MQIENLLKINLNFSSDGGILGIFKSGLGYILGETI